MKRYYLISSEYEKQSLILLRIKQLLLTQTSQMTNTIVLLSQRMKVERCIKS